MQDTWQVNSTGRFKPGEQRCSQFAKGTDQDLNRRGQSGQSGKKPRNKQ